MTLDKIVKSSKSDSIIQDVIESIRFNSRKSLTSKEGNDYDTYFRICYELSVFEEEEGQILLHDTRIIIPKDLMDHIIDIADEGHQGIVQIKQLLYICEQVYFLGIDKIVENVCKSFVPCLATTL